MLKIMQDEEPVRARRVMDAGRAQFRHIPFIRRQDVKVAFRWKPWIRRKEMDTRLLAAAFRVVVCGVQVFLRGIVIDQLRKPN